MKILAIETSCDETSAAVLEGKSDNVRILSNIISSQINIHKKYGGVVPEIAARNHILNIIPVVDEALRKSNYGNKKISVDLIAVTRGPGLMSSLLIGVQTAEMLAYAWKKPLIAVNHIEGHIYANWLNSINVKFPALALVVSGGHTQLVLMRDHLKYKIIGQTRDDAAGEAFDKVAKILNLGYPGGPIIAKMAGKRILACADRVAPKYKLPRPMIDSKDFDFSFSGLKTAVLYMAREKEKYRQIEKDDIKNICAEFQQAVIDVLVYKTIAAAKKYKVKIVLLAGGVAANQELRRQLEEAARNELGDEIIFNVPEQILCTDNAAMVGAAAYYRYLAKPNSAKIPPVKIKVDPNLEI
ncbi:MAG: tRNA (adenosine(37)-N6)-threonylcarbamoyltransferase complex transferase subunit TsaD [bacterium]